ncbi:Aspartyl-tRNA synthetase [Candidatus Saccharibacteria bacterium RAAC3_TM7_1]|nr:Aspartyl-tRNA synthetase [Candidatus Saccharibacteria bacterium RAAC3_TM7_1]HCZ28257.1 aspartate--tRNA(Asn) ligase [Candidatus Saccharibacteria bacterium]
MKRTLIRELPQYIDQTVTIEGWLHKKRLLGGLNFLTLRDRTGIAQNLLEDKDELEKLRGMQVGTVLKFTGVVVADERAPGGAELHDVTVEVMSPVTEEPPIEVDKPISHKSENLDTLFEYRVLNVRNLQEQKIFKIRAALTQALREFLIKNEFMEIDTPKLLAEPTEGGAEVFKLDYFGKTATLAQSPQFYKQIMVGAYERVFEIGHSYRAEPSATTRHLTELTMLDIEMGFVESHQEVMDMVAGMTKYALTKIYESYAGDLKSFNAPELKLTDAVPKFTIAQIHEMYSRSTGTDTTNEKDLIPDEERWIADYARKELGSDLVYATDFPAEAGKFYHKFKEGGTVAWADLLFRGLEIATVPLRENNYEKMIEQMTNAGLDVSHEGFKYYLQAFKYGLPQHGGCGFGIDRLAQKTIGLANVKEATLFPRDLNRLTP